MLACVVPLGYAATSPLNDLLALGHAGGQELNHVPIERRAEPPLTATPRADCGPGSRREPGIQGRVPAGAADGEGLHCNVDLIGTQGTSGGFKVHRYVDRQGRECGYYDTGLLFPVNAFKLDASSIGVAVVDMSDPSKPIQTDTLATPPMLSPHESLALNERRGLLVAVNGSPVTAPGLVAVYDVSQDCRHPVLQSLRPVARFGHESGFSEDGKTFYAAGTGATDVTAIDLTDPKNPHAIWHGSVSSHGLTLRPDGKRAYIADATGVHMLIMDTTEIQERRPNPQARAISRLTWGSASIPQNAIPFTRDDHPYVLEIDEYNAAARVDGSDPHVVGAARIIDVADERRPHVISNLRLQVNQPAAHAAANDDPGAQSAVQGYAAHYCDIPTPVNPRVVACSFIASGLRVFDITDLKHPREIAYYVTPTKDSFENRYDGSAFAMSKPEIVPKRREVWFTDGAKGFYVLRVAKNVWPVGNGRRSCLARRSPIGPRNIGRIRIGYTRPRLNRVPVAPTRRTRYTYRYCVRRRSGRVTAVFNRRSRRRGKVALVVTTARRHGNRGVSARTPARRFRKRYPGRRRLMTGVFRASRTSTRLIGVRRGRVRFVAVARRSLLHDRPALRRALRRALR